MTKRVSALESRKRLGELIEKVFYRGDQYVIERAGRPMAAVVPVWQLEQMKARRERLFGMIKAAQSRAKGVTVSRIEREVKEAVRAVRARGTRKRD